MMPVYLLVTRTNFKISFWVPKYWLYRKCIFLQKSKRLLTLELRMCIRIGSYRKGEMGRCWQWRWRSDTNELCLVLNVLIKWMGNKILGVLQSHCSLCHSFSSLLLFTCALWYVNFQGIQTFQCTWSGRFFSLFFQMFR